MFRFSFQITPFEREIKRVKNLQKQRVEPCLCIPDMGFTWRHKSLDKWVASLLLRCRKSDFNYKTFAFLCGEMNWLWGAWWVWKCYLGRAKKSPIKDWACLNAVRFEAIIGRLECWWLRPDCPKSPRQHDGSLDDVQRSRCRTKACLHRNQLRSHDSLEYQRFLPKHRRWR